jgi:hypothetical protein
MSTVINADGTITEAPVPGSTVAGPSYNPGPGNTSNYPAGPVSDPRGNVGPVSVPGLQAPAPAGSPGYPAGGAYTPNAGLGFVNPTDSSKAYDTLCKACAAISLDVLFARDRMSNGNLPETALRLTEVINNLRSSLPANYQVALNQGLYGTAPSGKTNAAGQVTPAPKV